MDYAALAKQFGGTTATPAASSAGTPAQAASGPTGVSSASQNQPSGAQTAPKMDYSALAAQYGGKTQEKPVGFVQGAIRAVVSPFLRAGANLASMADINNPTELKKDQQEGVSYGDYLGKFRPIGSPVSTTGEDLTKSAGGFGRMLTDTVGTGVEAAANFVGGGEAVDVVKTGLKGGIKQALVKGTKIGATTGALVGGGSAAQAPDSSVGSVVGGTAVGGILGAPLGAAAEAAGPIIGAGKSKAADIIASKSPEGKAATAASSAEKLVGAIAQGGKEDIPAVTNAMKQVDMTGVKTYADAAKAVDSHISAVAGGLDSALETNPYQKVTSELGHTTKVGGQDVTHNYVNDAMSQLRNFYEKTNDVAGMAKIDQLAKKGATEGLTVKEINNLAREHGQQLNAYNANNELATGLSKQAAENTRQGLKATARAQFNHPVYEQSDKVMSDLIRTKGLLQDMADKAQAAQQRIKEASFPQKIGSLLEKALNIGTLGTSRGALKAAGTAMGIKGGETMTTLELQKALQKNISKLDEILGTASKGQMLDKLQAFLAGTEDAVPAAAKAAKTVAKPSKQGGYVSLSKLAAGAGLGTAGAIAAATPSKFEVKNPELKAVPGLDPQDKNILAATVFGELSNKGDTAEEARKIINTVVNRMKETGKSARDIITQPNQYQAYGKDQFMNAIQGKLDPLSQKKMAVVNAAIDELYSGKLKDNTNGSVFYRHDKGGSLQLRPGKLKK